MLHECTEKYPEHVCPDEDEPGVELNTRNVAVLEGYLSYVVLCTCCWMGKVLYHAHT